MNLKRFFILFHFLFCFNSFIDGSITDDIETGFLRNRELLTNKSKLTSEITLPIRHSSPSRVSLARYKSSLRVNLLLFISSLLWSDQVKSDIIINGTRILTTVSLLVYISHFFWPKMYKTLPNTANVPIHYWIAAPLSWITEILLLLPEQTYSQLSHDYRLPDESVLCFIFVMQMVYYFSAYDLRDSLKLYKRSVHRRY